jgi:hypothetical protein
MSKRGSRYLRPAFWQAPLRATPDDPVLKELYEANRSAGKQCTVAFGAIGNKLVHTIYPVLRDNKPYAPALRESTS